jgi:hypothetical protein
VILANLRRDLQVGTEKREANLGDKLLEQRRRIVSAEVAIEPRRVPRPVRQFVSHGRRMRFRIANVSNGGIRIESVVMA